MPELDDAWATHLLAVIPVPLTTGPDQARWSDCCISVLLTAGSSILAPQSSRAEACQSYTICQH